MRPRVGRNNIDISMDGNRYHVMPLPNYIEHLGKITPIRFALMAIRSTPQCIISTIIDHHSINEPLGCEYN